MQEENIHSLSGIDLMTRVQENFPDMAITMGLLTKQYYFATDNDAANEMPQPDVMVNDATEKPVTLPDAEVADAPEVKPVAITGSLDTAEDTAVEDPPTEEVAPAEEEAEDVVTYSINNKVKTGTANVSSFKKEIDKLSRSYPEIRTILPLFTNLGVLDKFHIFSMGVLMDCSDGGEGTKERFFAAVDMLVEKGYLAEFTAKLC